MRNIARDVFRQRLLIEGLFQKSVDEVSIREYFERITKALGLKMYAEPIVHSPAGLGSEENQGYDAFAPLTAAKLVSVMIYSCKPFDDKTAKEVTREYFKIGAIETRSF